MYNIRPTTKFQKDLKRVKKRGFDISLLTDIIKKLAAGEPLPEKNRDHQLSGDYAGCRECHITPDWLLIYEVDGDELILYLTRTGSHSDLFFHRKVRPMKSKTLRGDRTAAERKSAAVAPRRRRRILQAGFFFIGEGGKAYELG